MRLATRLPQHLHCLVLFACLVFMKWGWLPVTLNICIALSHLGALFLWNEAGYQFTSTFALPYLNWVPCVCEPRLATHFPQHFHCLVSFGFLVFVNWGWLYVYLNICIAFSYLGALFLWTEAGYPFPSTFALPCLIWVPCFCELRLATHLPEH